MLFDCPSCGYPAYKGFVLCPVCGALLELGAQGFVHKGWMCFACGHENNNAKDTSCPDCNRRYAIECPECGEENAPKSAFCAHCRYDLNADRQRERDSHDKSARKPIEPPRVGVSIALLAVGIAIAVWAAFWAPQRLFSELVIVAVAMVFGALFALATHLPFLAKKPKKLGNYQEVYSSLNPFLAEHVRTILDIEGIEAFIYNKHSVHLAPFDPKGARVMVPKTKVADAESILKDFGLV